MSALPEEELIRLLNYGTLRRIREFINNNRQVNLHHPRVDLSTPLSAAIKRSDPSILNILIEKVQGNLNAKLTYACGRTPLMQAAFFARDPEILLVLIRKGVDIHARDIIGWNCLYYAVISKRMQNVVAILDNTEDLIESRDNYGRTPLMVSVYLSSVEIFKYLLTRGANVEAIDNNGMCALHLAIIRRKRDCVLELTRRTSSIDLPLPACEISPQKLMRETMSNVLPWRFFDQQKSD